MVIQQRTHQADLTGHLLVQGGWEHLCLPAQFERKTIIVLPLSKREIIKNDGELLCPEHEGRARSGRPNFGWAPSVTPVKIYKIRLPAAATCSGATRLARSVRHPNSTASCNRGTAPSRRERPTTIPPASRSA
jgi:hypothetical protein